MSHDPPAEGRAREGDGIDKAPAVGPTAQEDIEAVDALGSDVDLVVDVTAETHAAISAAAVPRFLRYGSEWAWRFLLVCAAIYVVVFIALRLRVVMIPVFVALVFTAFLTPIVKLLARRLKRLLATWVTLLALLATLGIGGYLLSQPIVDSIDDLSGELDPALDELRNWLQDGPLNLSESRVEELYDTVSDQSDTFVSGFTDDPGSAARTAGEIVGGTLLAFVLTFFALKDGPAMWRWLLGRVRPIRRAAVDRAGRASFASMQGWLRAAAITGVIDAVIIGAALLIFGVPAAVPLAVVTFFAAFFPIIGATAAGVLATLIAYASEGTGTAIAVAVVVLVVQQVEGDVVMPLVMQRHTSLHPVVILLALAAGGALGGIVGALVAVPVTAAVVAAVGAVNAVDTPDGVGDPIFPDGTRKASSE